MVTKELKLCTHGSDRIVSHIEERKAKVRRKKRKKQQQQQKNSQREKKKNSETHK